jgi:renal tumor antigen
MNIYELIRGRRHYVAEDRVRSYLYQLMKSLDHMHRNGIFHRCGPAAGVTQDLSQLSGWLQLHCWQQLDAEAAAAPSARTSAQLAAV